jgi:hypothetical protein
MLSEWKALNTFSAERDNSGRTSRLLEFARWKSILKEGSELP